MLHLNTHIFKHKNPGSNIILIARKSRKMFQSIKMYITQNEATRKFITEKSFSRKVLIFPDFPDIQSKFPDNSLIYRLAVNPGLVYVFLHFTTKRTSILFSEAILPQTLSHKYGSWSFFQHKYEASFPASMIPREEFSHSISSQLPLLFLNHTANPTHSQRYHYQQYLPFIQLFSILMPCVEDPISEDASCGLVLLWFLPASP